MHQSFQTKRRIHRQLNTPFFNRILLSHCEAMWVHTPRVSAGMRIEIEWAHINDLPIRYLDKHFGQVAL